MQEYNICYSLDSNYVEQLAVSITSILKNADNDDNINIYILDGGLTKDDKYKIELLKDIKAFSLKYLSISENDFKNCPLLSKKSEKYKNYHVTLPTYFRFKIAELLPKLSKVLYLDCDVIVRTSLKGLFETSLDGYSVAMVLDSESEKESKRLSLEKYYNAGVMLINLDYWRKNNIEQQLFDCAKNKQDIILWQDQDIVNIVLKKSIKELDNIFNFQYFQYENIDIDKLADVSILHLAGRFKPWLMSFESNIYDEYYYYLSFTTWKNNILKYKQNAFGKHLKNQVGGSVTNILKKATDEDIQKCFAELEENYKYTKGQLTVSEQKTDEKISGVYNEIEKSYEFTKDKINIVEAQTDEKISNIYNEITKSYEFTKEQLNIETQKNNEKISNIYDEIAKNYEFTKEQVKEASYSAEKSTNEKIDRVYEEITKNYKYTDELSGNLNNEIKATLNGIDEKVADVQREITKNYDFTKDKINIVEAQTDEKISNVYNEITKNYEYTNNLNNSVHESISDIQSDIENKKLEIDKEISGIKANIEQNSSYTEYLVESLSEKQTQKLEEAIYSVENEITKKEDKIYQAINNTYAVTDEKLEKLKEDFNININDLNSKINKDITHRFREIYLYSNDNFSKLYKGLKETSLHLENIVNDKVKHLYQNNDVLKQEIFNLKNTVDTCSVLVDTVSELKSELIKQNINSSSNIELLKKDYEEKLNQQRIKYEKKLMLLENAIEESNKNPISKFIDKIKKR